MDANVKQKLLDAVLWANANNEPYIVESSLICTYTWSMEGAADRLAYEKYISKSPEVYLVCPDGSVSLLSRDEAAVAEFAMLYELQR